MSDLFLSDTDLKSLTGLARGRDGKGMYDMQAEWLRNQGIPFFQNARNRPIVAREHILGKPSATAMPPKKKWEPKALMR